MKKNSLIHHVLFAGIGIISLMYLLNLGFGLAEILPDVLPVVGHIDEVAAFYGLVVALRYFGISIPAMQK